jgi:hypothetical protein
MQEYSGADQPGYIELAWRGPFSWFGDGSPSLFTAPEGALGGVYAWSAAMPDGDWVYYVGQTTKSFGDRHWEHWREYTSGAYGIPDATEFYQGRCTLLYRGFAYRRPAFRYFPAFTRALDQHLTAVLTLLRPMRLWVAELPGETRLQRRIESAVVRALYAQPGPASGFQEPGMRTAPRRLDEVPVRVLMRMPCSLVGLPMQFEA